MTHSRSQFRPSGSATDFALEVARGDVGGVSKINKFGEALDADSGVDTDIWDGADGTTSTDVWVAPTAARIHTLVSTSLADSDSGGVNPQSTGMRTVRVYYLPDWDTAEATEDVTLDGTTGVAMSNAAVIIHRMVGLTFGSGGTNAGIITATAATDSTITAAIQAGEGQTLMAIYGVPSTQKLFITFIEASIQSVGTVESTGVLLANERADQSNGGFVTKQKFKFTDTIPYQREFKLPKTMTGPCIVKLQVNTDTVNSDVTGGFDGYVVDN